jgi:hypothetical protein
MLSNGVFFDQLFVKEMVRMALTQAAIAKISGISSSFMCDILHERKKPSALVAEKLESVTKIEFRAWLMPQQYYNQLIHDVIGDEYSFIRLNIKPKKKGEKNGMGNCNTKTEKV